MNAHPSTAARRALAIANVLGSAAMWLAIIGTWLGALAILARMAYVWGAPTTVNLAQQIGASMQALLATVRHNPNLAAALALGTSLAIWLISIAIQEHNNVEAGHDQ